MRHGMIALATAAALTACAQTPEEVRASHFAYVFQSEASPDRAAACAARNAEEISGEFTAVIRPGAGDGDVEVVVRHPTSTVAVIDLQPRAPAGTSLRVYFSKNAGLKEDLDAYISSLARQMVDGC